MSEYPGDTDRIKKVVEEIGGSRAGKSFKVNEVGSDLLMEHAVEVTKAIVEGSISIAQHKGGKAVEVEDVTLFLAKKMGIILPGYPRNKALHQSSLKYIHHPAKPDTSINSSGKDGAAGNSSGAGAATTKEGDAAGSIKQAGVKRKYERKQSATEV